MLIRNHLILFLCWFGLIGHAISQTIPPITAHILRERIVVIDTASGFKSSTSIQSVADKNNHTCYIHYSSLETVTENEIRYYSEKNKWKLFRKGGKWDIQTPTDDFFSCKRTIALELPTENPFQVNYSKTSTDLMLQSNLLFYDQFPIDTFYYEIIVPARYHLCYKLLYPEKLEYFKVDSTSDHGEMTYQFTGVPKIRTGTIYKERESNIHERNCMMLTIITPASFAGSETRYFTNWILNKIKSKSQLHSSSIQFIDSITDGITMEDSVTLRLFNYMKDHIKYLSVEIGYGAFIPHDINKTLKTRQGDCKDKALLLCQSLRLKGINACVAIASTNVHNADMTFPSLSAGNHMICAVNRNNEWLFLDPTEPFGNYGLPGRVIQGRTVLILDQKGGTYVKVLPSEPELNREHFTISLKIDADSIAGSLKYTVTGAAMSKLKYQYSIIPISESAALTREILGELILCSTFRKMSVVQMNDSLVINSLIRLSPAIFTREGNTAFLNLGFLPEPMKFLHGNEVDGDIVLGYKVLRETDIRVETGKMIEVVSLKPVRYNNDGYQFSVTACGNGRVLDIQAHFRCDNISIAEADWPSYRKFRSFISTTYKNAITFE